MTRISPYLSSWRFRRGRRGLHGQREFRPLTWGITFRNIILQNKPIFIFGDFNDDLLKTDNRMSKLINNLKLHQLITEPTRITPNSVSLIDLFITNRDNYKEKKKEVKAQIDNSRKNYYKKELTDNKNNFSALLKIVKTMLFNNYKTGPQLANEDLANKAEKFNDYFANVGRKTYERTQEEMLGNSGLQPTGEHLVFYNNHLNSFKPSPVDCNTVILTVKSLNESSAYGSDGISLHFI